MKFKNTVLIVVTAASATLANTVIAGEAGKVTDYSDKYLVNDRSYSAREFSEMNNLGSGNLPSQYGTNVGGTGGHGNARVTGGASGQPLAAALQQITPQQCEIRIQKGLEGHPVTWHGGERHWNDVVTDMAQRSNLSASFNDSPCMTSVATSRGAAVQMLQPSGAGSAISASTGGMQGGGAHGRVYPRTLTYEQYLAEPVMVHVRGATLNEVLTHIVPEGWQISAEIDSQSIMTDRFDFTAQNTRGQVVAEIERTMGVKTIPYTEMGVLVVTE